MASDGLWDNVHHDAIFANLVNPDASLQEKAQALVTAAHRCGLRTGYSSPFYEKALKAKLKYPKQGKLDDNAVIIAKILREEL